MTKKLIFYIYIYKIKKLSKTLNLIKTLYNINFLLKYLFDIYFYRIMKEKKDNYNNIKDEIIYFFSEMKIIIF